MLRVIITSVVLAGLSAGSARAGFIVAHHGANDPTGEGFLAIGQGAVTTGPLPNDGGTAAWMIRADHFSTQYGYTTPQFNASQQADILSGFELTLTARAIRGNAAAYNANNTVVGGVVVDVGPRRFDLWLGVDSSGDTVVTLSNLLLATPLRAFGTSYTLTGLGSTYHTYKLAYDPVSQRASLSVDGVERITGYAGQTQFSSGGRFGFIASSEGQVNFNTVELRAGSNLNAVPAPPGAVLFALGAVGLLGRAGWRRVIRTPAAG